MKKILLMNEIESCEPEKPGCLNLKSTLLKITGNIILRIDNWMARDLIKEFEDFADNPYRED